ncbi:MAG: HEPN domain-containing protein [Bacteroidetes bacterium]|nr:HEPN domain-containing protein [Bacteroidota bacterium]
MTWVLPNLPIIIFRKFRDTIAFHCQQAVEKYLKSYLIFSSEEVLPQSIIFSQARACIGVHIIHTSQHSHNPPPHPRG